ncbi:response regulator [Thiorhodococcus mannitoliphagus]|uniref:Response regulator n=1 Tax=Thiorhodococcus mannitoliphagus TaxID=329406 RepID=A0A6P1DY29_9GAMM|nr:response regulator [Thiorhodococcus mannitoliphagus]NEX21901.1 response regulator [Thiorhodococcus mannitoliphagus]
MVKQDLLTPSQVAQFLGVSPVTVRIWARQGKLPAQTTPGGHRRFDAREIRDFARRHGMRLASESRALMRILIVEDDLQFAAFVNETLKTLEPAPEIETAYEGFEAGRRLQRFQPDLVLLDLMLPGVDGFAICQHLRNDPETAHIRVIAMTGYDSPENRARILDAGAEICLSKPFRAVELLAAVKTAIPAGKTAAQPAIAAGRA